MQPPFNRLGLSDEWLKWADHPRFWYNGSSDPSNCGAQAEELEAIQWVLGKGGYIEQYEACWSWTPEHGMEDGYPRTMVRVGLTEGCCECGTLLEAVSAAKKMAANHAY